MNAKQAVPCFIPEHGTRQEKAAPLRKLPAGLRGAGIFSVRLCPFSSAVRITRCPAGKTGQKIKKATGIDRSGKKEEKEMNETMKKDLERTEELELTDLEKTTGSNDINRVYPTHCKYKKGDRVRIKDIFGSTRGARVVALDLSGIKSGHVFYTVAYDGTIPYMEKVIDTMIA